MSVWTVAEQAMCGRCTHWVPIKQWRRDWAMCTTCLDEYRAATRARSVENCRVHLRGAGR